MNERCWTLLGHREAGSGTWRVRLNHLVEGEQTRVEADWSWTMCREENQEDVMGFFHTHPDGFGAQPSRRDIRTMQAWCSALGKPLLCLIAEESEPGIPRGYVFSGDEHPGQPVALVSREQTGVYLARESEIAPKVE
jgi:hypothetical protein